MHPELPRVLYHYTALDAFIGMVRTKQLWLSHARFLNDIDEIRRGQQVLCNALSFGFQKEEQAGSYNVLRPLESGIRTLTDYYVTCFSTSRDLLSLWRGYGSRGGVCIEFDLSDTSYFETLLGFGDSLAFHPAIYSDETFVSTIGALIEKHVASEDTGVELLLDLLSVNDFGPVAFRIANPFLGDIAHAGSGGHFSSFKKDRIHKLISKCSQAEIEDLLIKIMSHLVPLIKNEFFKEEGEVRLVLNPYKSEETADRVSQVIRHRISSINMIVPYVRTTDLLQECNPETDCLPHLPIKSVMVGPSHDSARIADSIRSFLFHHQALGEVPVFESRIPYRG